MHRYESLDLITLGWLHFLLRSQLGQPISRLYIFSVEISILKSLITFTGSQENFLCTSEEIIDGTIHSQLKLYSQLVQLPRIRSREF